MPSDRDPVPSANGPEFGVYVHWPFCASKCPYCDFNSHVRFAPVDEARFAAAFATEIAETRAWIGARRTTSVFLGGGTPSLMRPQTVAHILTAIDDAWPLDGSAEITLEANPSSVEADRFRGYRDAGVNRVSLGVQALDDRDLRALGRLHTAEEARRALAVARDTFPRWSFDLIYARPGQTEARWSAELAAALALAGAHLSLYQLTIEPGTPFAALHAGGRLSLPEPERAARLYRLTETIMAEAGRPAYEISNYASPGEESRHNLLYWRYGEYAGIGPGAHGRPLVAGRRFATVTEASPEGWLARVETHRHGRTTATVLKLPEQLDEALLMGLRLVEGLDLRRLAALHTRTIDEDRVSSLAELGLIERAGPHRIRATVEGRMVLNEIVLQLSRALGG